MIFACGIYPPEIGGPATVIHDAVTTLRSRGVDCTVMTYGEPREGVVAVSRQGNALVRYWRFARRLRALLRSTDSLIATDVFSVGIPARLALIGRKNSLTIRLGGEWAWEDAVNRGARVTMRSYWEQPTDHIRFFWKKQLMRWILRRSKKIILTTDLLREPIRQLDQTFLQRCVTVQNIHGLQQYRHPREGGDPVVASPHHPLRLLYVGRFAPVKNVALLSDVCRLLVARGVAYELTLVGSGPEESRIRAACEGLNVRFLPPVSTTGLPELYTDHDLLVLPSFSDMSPNAVTEALSVGLPCLLTSEHGLPRPVPGTVECDPMNANVWAEQIQRLTDADIYVELQSAAIAMNPTANRLADIL